MMTNGKRDQQHTVGPHHSPERIEEDHRTLEDQLDAVAGATTCTALLQGLRALPKMLQEHFALEEQVNGFYDDLQLRRPSVASALGVLRDEHRVILEEFNGLYRQLKERIDAEQTVEEITRDMTSAVASSLDRLRRHEHQESVMIGDVYYTDEGGLG
jgi:hypothetical protein